MYSLFSLSIRDQEYYPPALLIDHLYIYYYSPSPWVGRNQRVARDNFSQTHFYYLVPDLACRRKVALSDVAHCRLYTWLTSNSLTITCTAQCAWSRDPLTFHLNNAWTVPNIKNIKKIIKNKNKNAWTVHSIHFATVRRVGWQLASTPFAA
jgi:hypothetical protein